MRWTGREGAVIVSAWLAVACSSQTAPPAGISTPDVATQHLLAGQPMTSCVIKGEVPVVAEVPGFCGTLQVPEDPSDPSGRQIGLHVAVVPAVASRAAPDPFVAIAGGPGDASTSFFAWLPDLYAGVHATHDIVLVDQRGTGGSNALTLPALPDTSGLSASDADVRLSTWAKDALAALDVDPRFYTSTVAAADLDAVRAALGYDRIDLYGTSYGGELAQYYLRQSAEHVRVAILDGSTPLDVPVLERMATNSQHALDLVIARCDADPACHGAFPRLADEWSTLIARLRTGITTDVVDPQTGEHVIADLAAVGPGIHNALLTGLAAAQLPMAIHLAFEGEWDQAVALVPGTTSGGPTLLMADEIRCSESWARFDPSEVQRLGVGSYLLPAELAQAQTWATMCRYLPKGTEPEDAATPLRTTIPVVWLTGDGDPQDPPANLTAVMSQQPNGRVVVMPAQEHVVGHLGCGPSVIASFVDAGTASGLDTSCMEQGPDPAPTFRLP